MDDNRTLNGTVQFAQDGNFTISDQGEKFSPSKIRHLWSENMDDPLISAAQKTAEEMMMKWEHAFGLDLTGSSGNSENFGLGMRLDSNLGNKLRGYDLYLSYNKADKKNTPIVDETKFGIEYDSRFFDALSWYAKTDLENDKLEEIDLRATSSLGLKYSWIEQKNYQLSARSGMAFKYEKSSRSISEDQNDPAIDLGLEYLHNIKDRLVLESDLSYVPSLDEFEDFLISKDTALVFPLSKDMDWHVRSGLNGTYNSTPVIGKEELDLKYYLRLVYRFK